MPSPTLTASDTMLLQHLVEDSWGLWELPSLLGPLHLGGDGRHYELREDDPVSEALRSEARHALQRLLEAHLAEVVIEAPPFPGNETPLHRIDTPRVLADSKTWLWPTDDALPRFRVWATSTGHAAIRALAPNKSLEQTREE